MSMNTSNSCHDRTPLVSVIMIFLDAERFMAEAIDSVRSQTLEDWELVRIDDGSRDGSRVIAERYAAADPYRVRLFQHPNVVNRGTGVSRNLGLCRARGRYLCFLDADDVFEPLRLESAVSWLEADPDLGVVVTGELYWRSWQTQARGYGRLLRRPDEVVRPNAPLSRRIFPPALIASTLATPGAAMPASCSVTFRSADAALATIPNQFVSQYEDQVLITRLLLERSAVVLPGYLARYRQHPDSLTHHAERRGEYLPGRPHEARTVFLRWLRDYVAELALNEPVLIEAVNAELAKAADDAAQPRRRVRRYSLQRLALVAANLLLPRAVVDALISRYLRRAQVRIDRAATATAERIASALPCPGHEKPTGRSGGDR
jgi:glycosyltransferase involved in cell wall biosynthesis